MDKLVSSWYNARCLPQDYIVPLEKRPGKVEVPLSKSIPVIDLSEAENGNRNHIIQKILKASEEFGFFQVINHGVPENLTNETRSVLKEFFQMPAEYRQNLCSEDPTNKCRLSTSSANYATEKFHLWRDMLGHPCHPLEEWQQFWPENPTRYRQCVGKFSVEVKKLGSRIMRLISEGFGLNIDYFDNELSESMTMVVNYYPPCPEPSMTLGISQHSDPNLLTILLQDEIYGLQVLKDGVWIGVEPLLNAFVVNIGQQLQIITNGKLKSVEHRAVTNPSDARTSVAFFIAPSIESIIEPAKALTDESHPPIYRTLKYKDFLSHYFANQGDTEAVMEAFRAQL